MVVQHVNGIWEHKEIQACSLDLDIEERIICLAGKRVVSLVDADSPNQILSKHIRGSRLDASCIRCCPTPNSPLRLTLSSGQHFELYSYGRNSLELIDCVRAHPRNLTDLDWSPFDSNLLVTSAVDDAVHIWDLRDLKKPSASLQVVAGANQVKWCRLINHLLATAHDGDVRVWDIRKNASPLQYVPAHLSKVHGLEWHPNDDVCFATVSQDGELKLWDFGEPNAPKAQTRLPNPAWKLKFAPTGTALVTMPLPQGGRGNPCLSVWRANDLTAPVQLFHGHSDIILDVAWLPNCTQQNEPTESLVLYSVAKDQTLRAWNVNCHLLTSEVSDDSLQSDFSLNLPNSGATTEQSFPVEPNLDLKQEFDAIDSLKFDGVTIQKIDKEHGCVTVTAETGGHRVKIELSFTPDPGDSLKFQLESTLSTAGRASLFKQLQQVKQETPDKAPLIASCLAKLPSILQQLMSVETDSFETPSFYPKPYLFASGHNLLDPEVPFCRTSGAKFSASGILVCFGRVELRDKDTRRSVVTPRSITALRTAYAEPKSYYSGSREVSVKYFYLRSDSKIERSNSRIRKDSSRSIESNSSMGEVLEKSFSADVFLYDLAAVMPINKELARNYKIIKRDLTPWSTYHGATSEICNDNSMVAASSGRADLVRVWKLLAEVTHSSLEPVSLNADYQIPWAEHPFGRQLVNSLLDHFGRIGDFQTAALISCILSRKTIFPNRKPHIFDSGSSGQSFASADSGTASGYNTIHAPDCMPDEWASFLRQRSNSADDETPQGSPPMIPSIATRLIRQESVDNNFALTEENQHLARVKLLDPALENRLEYCKQAYADALYSWGLFVKSAEVLKFSKNRPEQHIGARYVTLCRSCKTECYGAQCDNCNNLAFQCCVCQISVKGLSVVCSLCGHGGHLPHMEHWFETSRLCPAGCGCYCRN